MSRLLFISLVLLLTLTYCDARVDPDIFLRHIHASHDNKPVVSSNFNSWFKNNIILFITTVVQNYCWWAGWATLFWADDAAQFYNECIGNWSLGVVFY